jgi:hypothetical protein
MSRCSTAALVLVFVSGCGAQLQAGAANAPALGGSPVFEPRTHDAIANGQESCEVREEGSPLRYRTPACSRVTRKPEVPEFVVPRPLSEPVVLPLGYSDAWACDSSRALPLVDRWSIFPCELPADDELESR